MADKAKQKYLENFIQKEKMKIIEYLNQDIRETTRKERKEKKVLSKKM